MKRIRLNKVSKAKIPRLRKQLDTLLSKLVRERDKRQPCIDLCGRKGNHQAGHFRRRECMSTRFDYRNVNGQNEYCNSWDNDGYRHAKGIDERWGEGTAKALDWKSRQTKQWTAEELLTLIESAKKGMEAYMEVYDQLSPLEVE